MIQWMMAKDDSCDLVFVAEMSSNELPPKPPGSADETKTRNIRAIHWG